MKYRILVYLKNVFFFALQIFEVMGKKSNLSPRKVALIKVQGVSKRAIHL